MLPPVASGTRLCCTVLATALGAVLAPPAPSTEGSAAGTGTVGCWSPGHLRACWFWRGKLVFSPGGFLPVAKGVVMWSQVWHHLHDLCCSPVVQGCNLPLKHCSEGRILSFEEAGFYFLGEQKPPVQLRCSQVLSPQPAPHPSAPIFKWGFCCLFGVHTGGRKSRLTCCGSESK